MSATQISRFSIGPVVIWQLEIVRIAGMHLRIEGAVSRPIDTTAIDTSAVSRNLAWAAAAGGHLRAAARDWMHASLAVSSVL